MNKLHFKGDWRKFVPNMMVGPDCWGAWYLPVSAHYFDGITTIFYRPVPPDKLPDDAKLMSMKVLARQQERGRQWPREGASSPEPRLPHLSPPSPTSRQSGDRRKKAARAGSGLTKSQRELLKRFKKHS